MSKFDDLDEHLQREESTRKSVQDALITRVNEAKERYLPQLQRVYAVIGDYYQKILQPKGYILIPRKKEGLTPVEMEKMHYDTLLFAYVANVLSPQEESPYPHDHDHDMLRRWSYPTIRDGDAHIWHPNIGLQVRAEIVAHDLEAKRIEFNISMQTWGSVKGDMEALIPQGITSFVADAGWDHCATFLSIKPDETLLDKQVETGLRLLTPNVIHHKKAFNRENF